MNRALILFFAGSLLAKNTLYAQQTINTDSFAIQHPAKAKQYQLLFQDNFNIGTKPSGLHWLYRKNAKFGGVSAPENVVHTNSSDAAAKKVLAIRFTYDSTLPKNEQYKGGGIASVHNFGYGYYEVKVKLYGGKPELSGLHQSFWSMGLTGTNEAEGKGVRDSLVNADEIPKENRVLEIDGFEQDSKKNVLGQNYHIYTPKHISSAPKPNHVAKDLAQWIVMAYEWLPNKINYYADGVLIASKSLDSIWRVYAPQNFWLTALPVNLPAWGGLKIPPPNVAMEVAYFKYYATQLKGINRIGNAGFEYRVLSGNPTYPVAWIVAHNSGNNPDAVKVTTDSVAAAAGNRFLVHQSAAPYKALTKQVLEYIPNGKYVFSAWVKSSGGQKQAVLRVVSGKMEKNIAITAANVWTKVALPSVTVTNNQATIEIQSDANANQWLMVDEVSFAELAN